MITWLRFEGKVPSPNGNSILPVQIFERRKRSRDRYTGEKLSERTVITYVRPSPTTLEHHRWTKKRGIATHPTTHPHALCTAVSTTAVVLQQQQHVQQPTHRPIHPTTHTCSGATARTAVRKYVHAPAGGCLICGEISFHVVLGFPCFHDPPPYRGPGTVPCDAPRWPSLAAATVLSPATPTAAAWGGHDTVARPRGVGWCSGAPGLAQGILRH